MLTLDSTNASFESTLNITKIQLISINFYIELQQLTTNS